MDLQLSGKRALVTGSASGIGEEITKILATEGVSVVHGRREGEAQRVAAAITAAGGKATVGEGSSRTTSHKFSGVRRRPVEPTLRPSTLPRLAPGRRTLRPRSDRVGCCRST